MKKKALYALITALTVLFGCATTRAAAPDELDMAIREASDYLNTRPETN